MTDRAKGGRGTHASPASSPVAAPLTPFLVEVFVARTDATGAIRLALDAESATEQMQREGIPVRLSRSMFVPDEETCFLVYQAATVHTVVEAAERAGLTLVSRPTPVVEWRVEDSAIPSG